MASSASSSSSSASSVPKKPFRLCDKITKEVLLEVPFTVAGREELQTAMTALDYKPADAQYTLAFFDKLLEQRTAVVSDLVQPSARGREPSPAPVRKQAQPPVSPSVLSLSNDELQTRLAEAYHAGFLAGQQAQATIHAQAQVQAQTLHQQQRSGSAHRQRNGRGNGRGQQIQPAGTR